MHLCLVCVILYIVNDNLLRGYDMRLKRIARPIGIYDRYNHGKVVHIDFTYVDRIVVWVEYAKVCRAYHAY